MARKADTPAPPLLELTGVVKDYPLPRTSLLGPRKTIRAFDNVSLSMAPGETGALVGRSGCGKSTLARLVLALDQPIRFADAGRVPVYTAESFWRT